MDQNDQNQDNPEQLGIQEPLFSLDVVELRPVIGGTAHLRYTAIASDGYEYAVKSVRDGDDSEVKVPYPSLVPASEWFCTKLAEVSGIPTPTCRVLKNTDSGEFLFGSQYDLSALSTPIQQAEVTDSLRSGESPLLRRQFWAIYAFDQFIFNKDRHLNNYLFSKNRDGSYICKAFDFSISSMVAGWPTRINGSLLPDSCNTAINWNIIKHLTSFDPVCKEYALKVLEYVGQIDVNFINNIFEQMPSTWDFPLQRQALTTWWGSKEKDIRLNLVRNEVLK